MVAMQFSIRNKPTFRIFHMKVEFVFPGLQQYHAPERA